MWSPDRCGLPTDETSKTFYTVFTQVVRFDTCVPFAHILSPCFESLRGHDLFTLVYSFTHLKPFYRPPLAHPPFAFSEQAFGILHIFYSFTRVPLFV